MRIQIDKIPADYILKRYTRYAKSEVGFNRHDKALVGEDGITQMYRTKNLGKKAMAAVRFGSMSRSACERTEYVLDKLVEETSIMEPDVGPKARKGKVQPTGEVMVFRQCDVYTCYREKQNFD